MAKVAIKNEKITSFGGICHIMDVFSKLGFEKLTESVLGKCGSSGKAFCYGSIFCGYHTSPLVWGFYAYARTKNPRKFPYQWMNPKNVTSIYKSTSQGIMLRNWGNRGNQNFNLSMEQYMLYPIDKYFY